MVRRHRDRLWAVALRTLADREEAADALQEALISAMRSSAQGGFRGEAAVTTWLHRIVVNACLDRVRRRQVRPTVPLPEQETGLPVAPDPYAALDVRLLVRDALASLPAEQAAALVLVDLQGFSVDDAAAVLGVAPGTVKSRCSRGRARLLVLLDPLRAQRRNREPGGGVPVPGTPSGPTAAGSDGAPPALPTDVPPVVPADPDRERRSPA